MTRQTMFRRLESTALVALVLISSLLRFFELGRLSFWYDEAVSMTIARTREIHSLLGALFQLDATRALLHPLILHGWIGVFGGSESSARGLSAVCGVGIVVLVYDLGRRRFDRGTGLLAAALATWCPPLLYYAREARMYSLLVLLSTLAWWLVSTRPLAAHRGWVAFYVVVLVLLGLCHPLGLLMIAALALASWFERSRLGWSAVGWLLTHLAAGVVLLGWLPFYLDHEPESLQDRPGLKFLMAFPLEYIGGNRWCLLPFVGFMAWGAWRDRLSLATSALWIWLLLAPVVLYVYSLVGYPIFGPSRYHLFVAPAYLLLVARGITSCSWKIATPGVLLAFTLAWASLPARVYASDLKADWRSAADWLRSDVETTREKRPLAILVIAPDPTHPATELFTARYYLDDPLGTTGFREVSVGTTANTAAGPSDHARVVVTTRDWPMFQARGWRAAARFPGLVIGATRDEGARLDGWLR